RRAAVSEVSDHRGGVTEQSPGRGCSDPRPAARPALDARPVGGQRGRRDRRDVYEIWPSRSPGSASSKATLPPSRRCSAPARSRCGANAGALPELLALAHAYQALAMFPCWLIQACMAIPAATATLMLRVDPN